MLPASVKQSLFDRRFFLARRCESRRRCESSTRDVRNCPPFSYEQQSLFEPKRQDVTDARSAEIDVVDHVRKFLDQTHTHRVRVVAKSAGPMRVYPSCHHPCYIDRPLGTSTATRYVVSGFSRTRITHHVFATSNRDAFGASEADEMLTARSASIAGPLDLAPLHCWFCRFWTTIRLREKFRGPAPSAQHRQAPADPVSQVSAQRQQTCCEKPDRNVRHMYQLRTLLGDGSGISAAGDPGEDPRRAARSVVTSPDLESLRTRWCTFDSHQLKMSTAHCSLRRQFRYRRTFLYRTWQCRRPPSDVTRSAS